MKILLVDDAADVRRAVAKFLRTLGHEIFEAENGQEALDFLGKRKNNIDVLITDYDMPKMNGVELILHLQIEKLNPRIILTSGSNINIKEILPSAIFLQKPVTIEQWLEHLQEETT